MSGFASHDIEVTLDTNKLRIIELSGTPRECGQIHGETLLEVCEARDPKGLYSIARAGDIANFTGISSPYKPPGKAEIHIDTKRVSQHEAADEIVQLLIDQGKIYRQN